MKKYESNSYLFKISLYILILFLLLLVFYSCVVMWLIYPVGFEVLWYH